jgi:hypothetical protein
MIPRKSVTVKPRFVRLAAQAGRDADEVRLRAVGISAGAYILVGAISRAVQQVKRFALRGRLIRIEQNDVLYHAGTLKRECRAGTDPTAAANDCYFHNFLKH